jgi:hypothetical protein
VAEVPRRSSGRCHGRRRGCSCPHDYAWGCSGVCYLAAAENRVSIKVVSWEANSVTITTNHFHIQYNPFAFHLCDSGKFVSWGTKRVTTRTFININLDTFAFQLRSSLCFVNYCYMGKVSESRVPFIILTPSTSQSRPATRDLRESLNALNSFTPPTHTYAAWWLASWRLPQVN